MKGFFLEQSGHNAEGFAYSSRALASDPGNLYAYHAVGHAYISRGDYREALETFERAASLEHYPHILWHLGEARAILGYEQFTRDYWAHTSPALPLFERIELLWRLEVVRQLPVDVTTVEGPGGAGRAPASAPGILDHLDAPLDRPGPGPCWRG